MKFNFIYLLILVSTLAQAQKLMSEDILLNLKRVNPIGVADNGSDFYYTISSPNKELNKNLNTLYRNTGTTASDEKVIAVPDDKVSVYQLLPKNRLLISKDNQLVIADRDGNTISTVMNDIGDKTNFRLSPDESKIMYSEDIQFNLIEAKQIYDDLPLSEVYVYNDLNYRHWDQWNNGTVSHVFWAPISDGKVGKETDILGSENYDCPQKPFGGSEDFIWDATGSHIIYVCKKKAGKAYALSTNTDIYSYDLTSGTTTNLTEGMMGYDMNPMLSNKGTRLAWTSMKRDGYEADKNDIVIMDMMTGTKVNITANWDGTVESFIWGPDDNSIFFIAPTEGTQQVFSADLIARQVTKLSEGDHNITSIAGIMNQSILIAKQSMNQATELYSFNPANKNLYTPVTYANTETYSTISQSKIEKRFAKAADGKQILTWIIYPPNYDPNKKYPALLYCQGGPQSQVSQFYSFRWNFQLMAAHGYIVIAPNRRGLPGFGSEWNESISKEWGGLAMQDYMAASDQMAKQIPAIDNKRIGAVGASYGGYSVYMLAGIHENRYKTFIAHCGLFDMKSWYGTTEELWFANWDIGGPYWSANPPEAYKKYNPSNFVDKWNTPIMIYQGGRDYRVPIEQGLEAYQAAQLRNIKSRLIYLPNENHWVLKYQNALAWQREFYKWLEETL